MADLTYQTFSGETNVVSQAEFDAIDKTTIPLGTIYKIADKIDESDLDSSLIGKTATGVKITNVESATSGTISADNLALLRGNANNYIVKEGKKYDRSSERTTADSLTYVYNGYLSGRELQEAIEITVSTKSWVLNADKLLTDKTIANGKIGGVSVKADFTDGLEVANLDGNLSIYGALDADITGRASKRPIIPTNLNKAVLAALTDDSKVMPNDDQQAAFKAAWGITSSMFDIGLRVIEITPASATSGTLSDADFTEITTNKDVCLKLNNEYYYLADDGHTEGIISYVHTGWNGGANQTKSINITSSTKAWTQTVGYNKYYRHYITLAVGARTVYYDFSSPQETAYTLDTLPVQPNTGASVFVLLNAGYYSNMSGMVYRDDEGVLKVLLHGIYSPDGTTVSYFTLPGTAVDSMTDDVQSM